jgi:hypothetical protein
MNILRVSVLDFDLTNISMAGVKVLYMMLICKHLPLLIYEGPVSA